MEESTRGKARKEDLFTLPNILCYVRILLVPLFIYLYFKGYRWQSAIVVVAAAVTDMIDGKIARQCGLVTDWGKFIDPVADKLMQAAMLTVTVFTIKWVALLCILFIIKEMIMLFVGVYIYHCGYNLNGAGWYGKVCTVIFDIVMIIFVAIPNINEKIVTFMIGITVAFLILSFVMYMSEYKKLFEKSRADKFREMPIKELPKALTKASPAPDLRGEAAATESGSHESGSHESGISGANPCVSAGSSKETLI